MDRTARGRGACRSRLGRAEIAVSEPEPLPRTRLSGHTIIVGYGQIGKRVAAGLHERSKPFLVIEVSPKIHDGLKEKGAETIAGNASDAEILDAANPAAAHNIVIAIPNAFEAGRVIALARAANPALRIVVRACSLAEAQYLRDLGASSVILGEEEIAIAMTKAIAQDANAGETENGMAQVHSGDKGVEPEISGESHLRQDGQKGE